MLGIVLVILLLVLAFLIVLAFARKWQVRTKIIIGIMLTIAIIGIVVFDYVEKQNRIAMMDKAFFDNGGVPITDYVEDVIIA